MNQSSPSRKKRRFTQSNIVWLRKKRRACLGEIIIPYSLNTHKFMLEGDTSHCRTSRLKNGRRWVWIIPQHLSFWFRPEMNHRTQVVSMFMNWDQPIFLTADSGGQFILADNVISEEGVTFKPSQWFQDVPSPEKKAILFNNLPRHHDPDECPQFYQPYTTLRNHRAYQSLGWCGLKARRPYTKVIWGWCRGQIQICVANQLRDLVSMDFPGYSIGGLQENLRRDECCLDLQPTAAWK